MVSAVGANAAGDMLSTPTDAVNFLNALFDGKVISQKQLVEMKDKIDSAQFPGSNVVANGHGMLVSRYAGAGGDIDVKGHLGQIPGHTSMMGRDEKTGVTAMLIPELRRRRLRVLLSEGHQRADGQDLSCRSRVDEIATLREADRREADDV